MSIRLYIGMCGSFTAADNTKLHDIYKVDVFFFLPSLYLAKGAGAPTTDVASGLYVYGSHVEKETPCCPPPPPYRVSPIVIPPNPWGALAWSRGCLRDCATKSEGEGERRRVTYISTCTTL